MQINISGKHIELGSAFQTHVEGRLAEGVAKYIDRVNLMDVVVTKEGHQCRVDIHGNTGTHSQVVVKSRADADDVYAAFDVALGKIEKQLRRYKRRLTNHHKNIDAPKAYAGQAKKYTLAAEQDNEELDEVGTPVVIAEKATDIETLTVSEAVMKMDLAHLPALMFYNSAHGRVNIVYRREDGNISWVDPQEQAA